MPAKTLDPNASVRSTGREGRETLHGLLSPAAYDDDASSLNSNSGRSDQESDSSDDELQLRARTSTELRAHDQMVLHDEEELEDLVEKQRKKKNRRPSALAPLTDLFRSGRRSSPSGGSSSLGLTGSSSRETLRTGSISPSAEEKRNARRVRRNRKKDRLMESAMHGEDGELMYEMEEGGMKDGSSTGSSSDREDSEEIDRLRIGHIKTARASSIRKRWLAIASLVAVAFLAGGILLWGRSPMPQTQAANSKTLVSNGTALFGPTTIIVSLDGFRADFLQRGLTPRLNKLIKEGVSPKYMKPSFPSVTFPNHYTIATGLYPEAHGVVGNTFWDPVLQEEFYYTDPSRSQDPKWWGGEPFWVTAEKQGVRTGVHMWPGSEAHIGGIDPSFLDKFNGEEPLDKKVARVFEFLDKPGAESPEVPLNETRAQLIAFYVPNVDADGHHYGPNSTEIRSTIKDVDDMLDNLFVGLQQRNLTDIVNVIIVSDHGMATTDTERVIQLDDLIDVSKVSHRDGWPLVGLRLHNDSDIQPMYQDLKARASAMAIPNYDVYLRDVDMPARYHFSQNERIAPLWIVPKTGWALAERREFDVEVARAKKIQFQPRGLHGYDNEHPLMRAIFIARGPAFPHEGNSEVDVFQNTEVYNMVCQSVGMMPQPNNATLAFPLKVMGQHSDEDFAVLPEDPEESAHASFSTSFTSVSTSASTSTSPIFSSSKPTSSTSTSSTSTSPTSPSSPVSTTPSVSSSVFSTSSTSTTTYTSTPEPSHDDGDDKEDDDNDNGDDDEGDEGDDPLQDAVDQIESFWDWITDKVGDLIDKVSGDKDKSS
ncbi:hypothetical protein TD95_005378 [Thielaviopsis punctulata]|uniref:Uncharacterized protein n=1 Tax=Thielaviopsis punctulata TaxID=72032 RepID=A0A0F4ZGT2_9PEZI|nr:hypothetical protein TD95_005378 [Thielaviopsis punctulata]